MVLALLLAFSPARAAAPSNVVWQAQNIYQIFTDRFFDGDAANNNASSSYNAGAGDRVHGGDFKGVEQKLDYIKALGATAIWISPIVKNGSGEYHGYAGQDFYSVDPHWGSLADLQSLINMAHAKGLLVIQDAVVNHGGTLNNRSGSTTFNYPGGYTLSYADSAKKFAAPFNTNAAMPNLTNLFHNYGAIQDYGNTTQAELGELSGLDDFRTETAYIRTNLAAVYNYWITNAGFDGFRIDTVKHVEMGFWQDWCPRIHSFAATSGKPDFFMFGEVWDNDAKCGSYTGTQGGGPFKLDSTVDFPLYFTVNSVFATATGNTKQIEDHYAALTNFDATARDRLVTFLDNHDLTRFMNSANANGNTNRLAVALAFLYTARGIPCLYQGTEQAFDGGGDPNNREDMFDGAFEQGPSLGDNFNMAHPMFQLAAKLNNFRRLYPALQTGIHSNLFSTAGGPGLFAYSRRLGTQEVFVVFNTAGSAQSLPTRNTLYPAGTTLVNLLNTNETITTLAGPLTPGFSVPGTTAKIFIAQAQQIPLDPVVAGFSPAHDATNVSALAPLVVQFSQPMDTNSVQAALTTTPSVSGSFAWSAGNATLTFTPAVSWPGLTAMTVRIADTAQAALTTNRLWAQFESRFRTSAASDLVAPTLTLLTPTNGATVGGMLVISGTAADNISVAKVEVQLDNLGWVQASGTTSWSHSLNTSNVLNGLHTISARATDTAANPSSISSVSVRFINQPGAYLQRLACGNPSSITDCSGNVWLLDQAYTPGGFGYSGGGNGNVANTVVGICAGAQSLYQRERFGSFSYQFDCPIGVYETTLLEAETWFSGPGQRVFNLFIQGGQVLTNFDIFVAAGGQNRPLTLVFTNSVTNGQLQLIFSPVVDNARVSGLQARKIADVFSDSDGIPDWWRLAYFGHGTGQAGDLSRGADDADGDGMANANEFLAGTDPLNPASVFAITGVSFPGGTNVQVICSAVSNRPYQLLRRDALAGAGAWTPVGSAALAVSNSVTLADPGGPANSARFYRVQTP
jgi:glycosidase